MQMTDALFKGLWPLPCFFLLFMPKDIATEEGKLISERGMLKYATWYHKTPFLHFGVRLILFSVRVSATMRAELINWKICAKEVARVFLRMIGLSISTKIFIFSGYSLIFRMNWSGVVKNWFSDIKSKNMSYSCRVGAVYSDNTKCGDQFRLVAAFER